MSDYFTRHGAPTVAAQNDCERVQAAARALFRRMGDAGASSVEIRAMCAVLIGEVAAAASETILARSAAARRRREDASDSAAAQAALKDAEGDGTVSWEEIRAEFARAREALPRSPYRPGDLVRVKSTGEVREVQGYKVNGSHTSLWLDDTSRTYIHDEVEPHVPAERAP